MQDLSPASRVPSFAKVHSLERKVSVHERNIAELADSMADLLAAPPPPPKRPIGFVTTDDTGKKTSSKKR